MNYFKNISYVACFPRNGWAAVKHDEVQWREVQSRVLYPMLAVLALSAFMALVYDVRATLVGCIVAAVIDFAKYFFSFFIASYVVTGYFPLVVKDKRSVNRANVATLYCMAVIVALNIIDNLLPASFPYLKILYLYVFFMAWKADRYLGIEEGGDKKILIVIAALVLLLPLAISYLLGLIMNKIG